MGNYYAGVEDNRVLDLIKLKASMISFGTESEFHSALSYANVIIAPVKYMKEIHLIESGDLNKECSYDTMELLATRLLAAFCLAIVYSRQSFHIKNFSQPSEFFTEFFIKTGCVSLDENQEGRFDVVRFEQVLRFLQNTRLIDRYFILDEAEKQIVTRENILKSYKITEDALNESGAHPLVYHEIERILSKDFEERANIYCFMTQRLTEKKIWNQNSKIKILNWIYLPIFIFRNFHQAVRVFLTICLLRGLKY